MKCARRAWLYSTAAWPAFFAIATLAETGCGSGKPPLLGDEDPALSCNGSACADSAPPPKDAAADVATLPDTSAPDPIDGGADVSVPDANDGAVNLCPPRIPSGSVASGYQSNPAHDGVQPNDRIVLPLCRRWSRTLGAGTSYPVVANGRVFVTTMETDGTDGTRLYALDAATGATLWGPIALGGVHWAALAWDGGRVFAANAVGRLRAFADDTGALLWETSVPGVNVFSSAPVATGGVVYVAPQTGKVHAFTAATGALAWSFNARAATYVSPAVAGSAVYVTNGCGAADAIDIGTHGSLWRGNAHCSSAGGGGTPVFGAGKVYARDFLTSAYVYDASNGDALASITTRTAPAVTTSAGYFVNAGDVQAVPHSGLAGSWTFSGRGIETAPLVVGDAVILAGATGLWVVDKASGVVIGNDTLPDAVFAPDEWNYTRPLNGLAAADGRLFVPTRTGLVAY